MRRLFSQSLEQSGPGGCVGSRCQEVVARLMFFLMTGSGSEVQRKEALVPGVGFHGILVESVMRPQITCSPASLLDRRVRGFSEVSRLVQKGAGIGTPLRTQFQGSFQPTTWLLFLSSSSTCPPTPLPPSLTILPSASVLSLPFPEPI